LDADTRLQHSPNATFQVVAEEAILIHLHTGVYYSLNDVGTSFWNLMDGQHTVGQCAEAIAVEYNAPPEVVLSDLIELAEDLKKEDLVA
jgi:Coenzyme PQQ synthesis protein D (PqqD)